MDKSIKYIVENWKLIVHLMFRTYRFGVNNQRWSDFDSMFGIPIWKRFRLSQIIENYRGARFRACACYFISEQNARLLFPLHFKRKDKRNYGR